MGPSFSVRSFWARFEIYGSTIGVLNVILILAPTSMHITLLLRKSHLFFFMMLLPKSPSLLGSFAGIIIYGSTIGVLKVIGGLSGAHPQ